MDNFTFEGFEPANTTPVPDVLFDKLLTKLSGAEVKVLLYIIRRTLGFKKMADSISLTQFEKGITTRDGRQLDEGCGLHRETICNALESLEKKGCITTEKRELDNGEKDITTYCIHFKHDEEVVGKSDHALVGKNDRGSRKIRSEVVGKSDLQETVLQDTDKQETDILVAAAPASDEEKQLKERSHKLYADISQHCGGPMRSGGKVINERKCCDDLVKRYSDEQIKAIRDYLMTQHWRWSKSDNKFNLRAFVINDEADAIAQILREQKNGHNGYHKPPSISSRNGGHIPPATSLNKEIGDLNKEKLLKAAGMTLPVK